MVDPVVVVGAGPVGMVLAAELVLAGVDVSVLERRTTPELVGSRAGGFHARTIEVLDQRGIAERFLEEGQTYPVTFSGSRQLDVGDLPTRHPYVLGLTQNHIERILAGWIDELGVRVERGVEVLGLVQDDDGVTLTTTSGERRAAYVVGADGGRSLVRKAVGIDFPGWEATHTSLVAEVEVTEPIPSGVKRDENGVHGLGLMENGHTVRVVVGEPFVAPATEPTLADLSSALHRVFGTDFGVHDPTSISRFSDATRQASSYRRGRVLLVGDAAHTHTPAGGQGLGIGVQDAVNLGWKLAQVVRGQSPDALLDSYHDERHPAGARTLQLTMAISAQQRSDPRSEALNAVVDELMEVPEARRRFAARLEALDVAYDLGEGHPLLGRRIPDLDLMTSDGPRRCFELLHEARPVLLDLGAPDLDLGAWTGRVTRVRARYDGTWVLPVVGEVPAPTGVLIRPDGHVAWVGEGGSDGLRDSLARWFGPDAALS